MVTGWVGAAAYVVAVWWATTGLVLYLDGLPATSYRRTFGVAILLFFIAAAGVWGTLSSDSVAGVFCAFSCAVALWGCIEVSYLTNQITGPEKRPCPADCRGLRRFGRAIMTSLYHELLIVAIGASLVAVSLGAANKTAMYAFAVLWLMRWSAKINIFLGVRNLNEDWLPEHLKFLISYMRKQSINWFFPVSIVVATAVAAILFESTLKAANPARAIGGILVFSLLVLAILEHWLLILPFDATRLWVWGMRSRLRRD